jgi:hypothetical protein
VGTSASIAGGVATVSTSNLSIGNHAIVAYYSGDALNAASSSTSLTQTVTGPTATTTTLSSSSSTATYGQPITLTATIVPANATGSVVFSDTTTQQQVGTSASIAGGVATVSTSNLSIGTHVIVAYYSGDALNAASSSTSLTQTVTAPTHTYYLPFLANGYIPAGQTTGYTSYVVFQNSGSAAANISIQYADQTGANLTTGSSSSCATLALNAECIPANPFPLGTHGTAIITSSQPLSVIVAEATPFGGSAYAVAEGGASSLIAPIALNGAFGGYITQLTTYNGGASAAPVTIQFFKDDGTHVVAADQIATIPSHSTFTVDQTAASSNLPVGFSGWAQITGAAGSTLVAQVLEQNPNSHFVAIANAQHGSSTTVYAPAVFNKAYGLFITGANIVNPGSSPVTVTVTYYSTDGTTYAAAPFSLGADAIASVYQGANGGTGLPIGGLPSGFAGSAIVTASGSGVVMVVNENGGLTATGSAMSGTYEAASSGAGSIALPVMANNGFGYITGATILNISNQSVSGSVQYYKTDGSTQGGPQAFTIGAHASQAIFQASSVLPGNFYGDAVVTQTSGSANSLIVTTNAISTAFFYTYTEPNN